MMAAQPGPETSTLGKSEIRKDTWEKVTGKARYTGDIPGGQIGVGMLLRSPHHHARILRLDVSRARRSPGVRAVLTAEDIPGIKVIGPLIEDEPVLAGDTVLHMGQAVALVVAGDRDAAERALKEIDVEYQPLPAVFDPVAALQPGAPRLHAAGNLAVEYDVSSGDPEAALAEAEVVVEETFLVPRVSPAYMEPETSLAEWHPGGSLTVWVSSQKPFMDRNDIARVLGLPQEEVQVRSAVIGGAFGGREDSSLSVLAALAAWGSHSSVRLVNTRSESFLAHPKRHPAVLRMKIGAGRDGRLVALEAVVHMDTGAFASYGPAVGSLLTEVVPSAYFIPNVRVDTKVVYTNSPFSGAVRGFGSPQAHFAMESLMDMLAAKLGLDPLELRRKNVLHPGDRLFTQVKAGKSAESLPLVLEHAGEARRRLEAMPPSPGKRSGVGVALFTQSMGLGNGVPDDSTNRLEWLPDGRVRIFMGAPDMGQGLATAMEQIAAETLGIPYARIETVPIDTRSSPDGGVSCASRMTYLVGNSVKLAAEKMIDGLLDYAAGALGKPRAELSYAGGSICQQDGTRLEVAEFTGRAAEAGIPLCGQATFSFPYPPETTPRHLPVGMPHVLFCYGADVARVEVDLESGKVEVTDIVAIHDVGRVINRRGVEGQIEGGVSMGVGYALFEEMPLKRDGRWVDTFAEYLLPTVMDLPAHVEPVILEVPEDSGPYGAKGVAEMSTTPTAPAIANAVFAASGYRARSLPIRPEQIVEARP